MKEISLEKDYAPYLIQIQDLYIRSFPENERRPLDDLIADEGKNSEILVILENGVFAGFMVLLFIKDYAHLIYFCIEPKMQGTKIGSRSLKKLTQSTNKIVFADLESKDPNAGNASERERRFQFYKRNGFDAMDINYKWRNENFTIVATEYMEFDDYANFWDTIESINPKLIAY